MLKYSPVSTRIARRSFCLLVLGAFMVIAARSSSPTYTLPLCESPTFYGMRTYFSDLRMDAFQFGIATDTVLTGDYDGDTRSDAVAYRPSTGTWYIRMSGDQSVRIVNFGIAEDIPMRADIDGDGMDDISVYRPSTGTWYALLSSNGSFWAYNYGLPGDIPVPSTWVRR